MAAWPQTGAMMVIVLAFDTSTLLQTVAVVDDGRVLAERAIRVRRSHARRLLGTIDACLKGASVGLGDLGLVSVGIGPGSFTGLRIGVATAKALCFALGCPLVRASSLAAMAHGLAVAPETLVVTATDARKKEVYGAVWRLDAKGFPTPVLPADAFRPEVLAQNLGRLGGPLVGLGNGFALYPDALQNGLQGRLRLLPAEQGWPRAVAVAALGLGRFRELGGDELANLEPHYIRPSDAELNLGKDRS